MGPLVMARVMGVVRQWFGGGDLLKEAEAEAARAVRASKEAEEEVRRRSEEAWEAAREAGRAAERAVRALEKVAEVRLMSSHYKEGEGW